MADIKFQRVRGGDVNIEISFVYGRMGYDYGRASAPPHPSIEINDDKRWGFDANDSGKLSILADS